MNKQQRREELLMDKQEIETTFGMGYFETNMKLDLYSIEEALLSLDNEEYEFKKKQKNKLNRHKINHINKMHDRNKCCSHSERKLKKTLKHKAKKKLRNVPIGEEYFEMKGCSFHKVYCWKWDLE